MSMCGNQIKKLDTPLVATPQGAWYPVSVKHMHTWLKQLYGHVPEAEATTKDATYYMFVPQGVKPWTWDCIMLSMQDQDLGSVNNWESSLRHVDDLKALVHKIGAQSGTRLWGSLVVYQGDVFWRGDSFKVMPQVGQVRGETVHEVPKSAEWILNKLRLNYHMNADKILVFWVKTLGSWACVSIKKHKVTLVSSNMKVPKELITKLTHEVATMLGLSQVKTTANYLMPNSKMHRMLKLIQDHPRTSRINLYYDLLKLKQMPAYKSESDETSRLVSYELVSEHGGVTYEITIKGKMVLAMLNAGKQVPLISLIKA